MKTFLFLTLSFLFLNLSGVYAQDTVINRYAAILGDNSFCNNAFQVDSSNGFFAGDTVLMIQMKGAVLDTTNSASFGNVLDYRSAGNYEYNVVKSVSGNIIRLKYKLRRTFEIPDGKVQLVKVASFSNYTTTKTLTAMQWNGRKGGVFAINVANTLTLNHAIDLTGKGFAGGSTLLRNSMTFQCNAPNYYYPANVDSGGMKGEGFANVGAGKTYGKGKLGNGGGGGNSTNAGGGGGSNAGSAGNGGNQWANCSPITGASGIGGLGTTYSNASGKIFMGGGGGAGHMNDSTNVAGGNGGGIVFIKAGFINVQSTGAIRANGAPGRACTVLGSTTFACADGMGGGGGGGGVLLEVNTFSNNISVAANGGKGADMIFIPGGAAIHGPGGGGGGGFIWTAQPTMPASVSGTTTAGANGVTTYNGATYGATPGASGQLLSALAFAYPVLADTFAGSTISASISDSVSNSCFERRFFAGAISNPAGIISWNWHFGGTNTATSQNPVFNFGAYGSYTARLIATNVNGCADTVFKTISIQPQHFAYAGADVTICRSIAVQLNASGGVLYTWTASPTLSNTAIPNPIATPTATTTYYVTVTDLQGCTDRDTVSIVMLPAVIPTVTISANPGLNIALGQSVTFTAVATNAGASPTWQWRKNGINIPGAALATYTTNAIVDGDQFSVVLRSSDTCAVPDSSLSNALAMRVTKAAVGNLSSSADLFLFPNPNSGTFTISGTVLSRTSFRYKIMNTIGQTLQAGSISVKNGVVNESIVLPQATPAGAYIFIGTDGAFNITRKFSVGIPSK